MRSGCRAARGSPADRIGRARPADCAPHAAAGERPDDVPRRIRRACPPPTRRAGGGVRRGAPHAESARRHPAAPYESRASPSRQSQLTASCGCARKAPPEDLKLRSGRERATTLAAPTGYDRASGTSAHPQAEAMHAGSAPVIRLEGPLALGHDVLLVVLPSGRSDIRIELVRGSTGGGLGAAGRRGPQVVRVAAVSPTFGRLFEGTDEASPGQTWLATTKPHGGVGTFSVSVTPAAHAANMTSRSKPHVP